jgi:beta-1,4-N-acetylglucosaminyltransferase
MAKKTCFITIGATAAFDALIKASLEPSFLDALRETGYTDLILQYGKDGQKILQEYLDSKGVSGQRDGHGIAITGFDFKRDGLGAEMRAAKGESGGTGGVVVSHAGGRISLLGAVRAVAPDHA